MLKDLSNDPDLQDPVGETDPGGGDGFGPEVSDQMTDIIDQLQSRIDTLDTDPESRAESVLESKLSAALETEGVSLEDLLQDGFEMDADGSHTYWINQETREMFESDHQTSITDQVSAKYRERHEETTNALMEGNIVVQHYRIETNDETTEGYTFQMMDGQGNVSTFSLKKVTAKETAEIVNIFTEPEDDDSDEMIQVSKIELIGGGIVTAVKQQLTKEHTPTVIPPKSEQPKPAERSFLFEKKPAQQTKVVEVIPIVTVDARTTIIHLPTTPKPAVEVMRHTTATSKTVERVSFINHSDHDDDSDFEMPANFKTSFAEARTYQEMSTLVEPPSEPIINVVPRKSLELFGIGLREDEAKADQAMETVPWTTVLTVAERPETIKQSVTVTEQEESFITPPVIARVRWTPMSHTDSIGEAMPTVAIPDRIGFWSPRLSPEAGSSQNDEIVDHPDHSAIEDPRPVDRGFLVARDDGGSGSSSDLEMNIGGQLEDDETSISMETPLTDSNNNGDSHAELFSVSSEIPDDDHDEVIEMGISQPEQVPHRGVDQPIRNVSRGEASVDSIGFWTSQNDTLDHRGSDEAQLYEKGIEHHYETPLLSSSGLPPFVASLASSGTRGSRNHNVDFLSGFVPAEAGIKSGMTNGEFQSKSLETEKTSASQEPVFVERYVVAQPELRVGSPMTVIERDTLNVGVASPQREPVEQFEPDASEEPMPVYSTTPFTKTVVLKEMIADIEPTQSIVEPTKHVRAAFETNDDSGVTISTKVVVSSVVERTKELVMQNEPAIMIEQEVQKQSERISRREAEQANTIRFTPVPTSTASVKTVEWAATASMMNTRAGLLDEEDVEPPAISIAEKEYERVLERV